MMRDIETVSDIDEFLFSCIFRKLCFGESMHESFIYPILYRVQLFNTAVNYSLIMEEVKEHILMARCDV